jgi:hypothetical protein
MNGARLIGALVALLALVQPALAEREEDGERGDKAFASFLKSCALRRGDIYFDRELAMHGKERVRVLIAAGKGTQYLAAISDEGSFVYVKLPWRGRGDLRTARVVDLAGDGREALVLRYREGGGDVLGIWRLPSESHIRQIFAADVASAERVRFARRGRGNDLLIEGTARRERYQLVADRYERVP